MSAHLFFVSILGIGLPIEAMPLPSHHYRFRWIEDLRDRILPAKISFRLWRGSEGGRQLWEERDGDSEVLYIRSEDESADCHRTA